jgi:hypothetical protein
MDSEWEIFLLLKAQMELQRAIVRLRAGNCTSPWGFVLKAYNP